MDADFAASPHLVADINLGRGIGPDEDHGEAGLRCVLGNKHLDAATDVAANLASDRDAVDNLCGHAALISKAAPQRDWCIRGSMPHVASCQWANGGVKR